MLNYNSVVEYDEKGRTIRIEVREPKIIISYKYENDIRICTSSSSMNSTNHLEITTQKKIKGEYVDVKKFQEGEIYDVTTGYDCFGNDVFMMRLNKKTNSIYRKKIIRNKFGVEKIWFEEYNKVISMGFKVDIEKILKKTC